MSSCDPCTTPGVNGAPGGGGGGGPPAVVTLQAAIDGQGVLQTEQAIATTLDMNAGGSWTFRDAANLGLFSIADITGVTISQQLRLTGAISPAALAAGNTNDYAPAGGATSSVDRLTPNAAGSIITGLTGGATGRMIVLENISTTIPLGLTHDDAGSAAANRFFLPNNASYSIPPNGSVPLWYDTTSSRWRLTAPAAFFAPGTVIWTFANAGGPADGIIRTTNAVPVFRTWASLPNAGDAVDFFAMFSGHRDNGDDCLFRQQSIGYARNAVGSQSLAPIAAVISSGFDETGLGTAPWNNLVNNPAGWGGGANFEPGGNILQVAFNGAAGENVEWRVMIIAIPFYGAVISL